MSGGPAPRPLVRAQQLLADHSDAGDVDWREIDALLKAAQVQALESIAAAVERVARHGGGRL